MNRNFKYLIIILMSMALLLPSITSIAGNKDRSGEAGAHELLINPWSRSSSWGGADIACVRGIESIFSNVAGLAFTNSTDIIASQAKWLKGSTIDVYSAGLAQRIGESNVFGLSIMSMNFGDLPILTNNVPDGGIGSFSPRYLTVSLAYSKAFSNSIYGGLTMKVISESTSDLKASGVAIDAGIQYVTGDRDHIRFGITLKNVGPTLSFSGDGLSIRTLLPGQESYFTVEQRSAEYELPTQLSLGVAYDLDLGENHGLTLAGSFISNAFNKDQISVGAEYRLKSYLALRAGYTYEDGILSETNRTTPFTGLNTGISVSVPISKDKESAFSIDYSFRPTVNFQGTHVFGLRFNL